ncbi:MAG: hypothetical protein Kow00133_17860 [Amphiplicatus sp.]
MANPFGNPAVVRDPVTFTPDEVAQLQTIYNRDDPSTYAAAYNYIHDLLSNKYKDSVDPDTIFWFKQAPQINVNQGNAALFIRTFTRIGLEQANREVGDLDAVSNLIAVNVIDDVIDEGGVRVTCAPWVLHRLGESSC